MKALFTLTGVALYFVTMFLSPEFLFPIYSGVSLCILLFYLHFGYNRRIL